MHELITQKHHQLTKHSLYSKLDNIRNLQIFMQYHSFAVWDFMSLLKSLQRQITTTGHPWQESSYQPRLVRLINEIVLGEESDLDQAGEPTSHFALYLKAMREIGADTTFIDRFSKFGATEHMPREMLHIVRYHLDLAESGSVHEVASSFFFGREKLIPDIFTSAVNAIKQEKLSCPTLIYYLERHIEVDGDEHGPMALQCLQALLDSPEKEAQATATALKSLEMRQRLWDFIESQFE